MCLQSKRCMRCGTAVRDTRAMCALGMDPLWVCMICSFCSINMFAAITERINMSLTLVRLVARWVGLPCSHTGRICCNSTSSQTGVYKYLSALSGAGEAGEVLIYILQDVLHCAGKTAMGKTRPDNCISIRCRYSSGRSN